VSATGSYSDYCDGTRLIGDDFPPDQIEEWFSDEREGYFSLSADRAPGSYGYHELNRHHGFRHLPDITFQHVLGIGSAFGEELSPIFDRAHKLTILEPSDGFVNPRFQYVKPSPSGLMPFASASFDLITCFGVLHHIPNVTTVIREIARCLTKGGFLLLREPTHSMGNWDNPRRGLTRRERGIPLAIMHQRLQAAGLRVVSERRCMFALTSRIQPFLPGNRALYNTRWVVNIDDFVANLPVWSNRYHASNFFQRLRPWAVFMVITRDSEHAQEISGYDTESAAVAR
jgi:SAM-dependent methyltransferase